MALESCRYSCDTCNVSRVVVKVEKRTDDDWDAWKAATLATLQADHLSRSNLGVTCPGTLVGLLFGLDPDL